MLLVVIVNASRIPPGPKRRLAAGRLAGLRLQSKRSGLAGWLDGWLADWLAGWLAGWLVGWLVGRLVERCFKMVLRRV